MTSVFETTDIGAARSALSRLYDIQEFSAPGSHPYVRIEQDVIGPVRLYRLTFDMQCDVGGGPLWPVRFTSYQPATSRAKELWLSTSRFVRNVLTSAPAGQPLVAGAAARLLAATALAVFPNNALEGPGQDSRDTCPATVRRAVTFIDDNAHRDISAADIAAAASVTLRALQLAFRRHLDTTPTAYLRRVRLEHARRQLSAADPGRETVTAVAYRWGFPSPSRFAAYYRQAYGTLPSQTLHGQPGFPGRRPEILARGAETGPEASLRAAVR